MLSFMPVVVAELFCMKTAFVALKCSRPRRQMFAAESGSTNDPQCAGVLRRALTAFGASLSETWDPHVINGKSRKVFTLTFPENRDAPVFAAVRNHGFEQVTVPGEARKAEEVPALVAA
jgi:hypothetical protein